MVRHFASVLLSVLLFSHVCLAEDGQQLKALVAAKHPLSRLVEESSGYLDDKSAYNLVLIVTKDAEMRLLLFREGKNTDTPILEEMYLGGANSRTSWTAAIRNRSIFLSYDSSGGCCSHSGGTLQFKLRNEAIRLVGYSELSLGLEIPPSDDSKVYYEARTSINLLTGDFHSSRATSRRIEAWSRGVQFEPHWRQFLLLPPLKRSERKGHFRVDRVWNFGTFDNDAFTDWLLTKNIYDK